MIASAITTVYNGGKYISVTLRDEYGHALKSVNLNVKFSNGKKVTLTTDKYGKVKVSTDGLAPKVYTASITFAGNTNYAKSTKSVKVTVKKATIKLTAGGKAFKLADKTKKYVLTLKTNQNKPLKNVWVYIKVNGITYSAKTTSSGQAVFKLTKLKKIGSFSAAITFKGNNYYNKLYKAVKITVKK